MTAISTIMPHKPVAQEPTTFQDEVARGERFNFGKNWASFLGTLDETRIAAAVSSLQEMLQIDRLDGVRFLDIGSGSGLFSLAARRLGARVISFDFDPDSVGCAQELRRRFFPDDENWRVEQGSVLDRSFMESLGQSDIVYSWGVLHHTGRMWDAIDNAWQRVAPEGSLFISLYNNEGWKTRAWTRIKRFYCSGRVGRWSMTAVFVPFYASVALAQCIVRRTNQFADYKRRRGMSMVHDWIDWIGGYPFETARVEQVLKFLRPRGFELVNLKSTNRMGCNQFVFQRTSR